MYGERSPSVVEKMFIKCAYGWACFLARMTAAAVGSQGLL